MQRDLQQIKVWIKCKINYFHHNQTIPLSTSFLNECRFNVNGTLTKKAAMIRNMIMRPPYKLSNRVIVKEVLLRSISVYVQSVEAHSAKYFE
jgi:hypothetical protein